MVLLGKLETEVESWNMYCRNYHVISSKSNVQRSYLSKNPRTATMYWREHRQQTTSQPILPPAFGPKTISAANFQDVALRVIVVMVLEFALMLVERSLAGLLQKSSYECW